jgi:hypothetical protein
MHLDPVPMVITALPQKMDIEAARLTPLPEPPAEMARTPRPRFPSDPPTVRPRDLSTKPLTT